MEKFKSVDEILDFAIGREAEAIELYSDLLRKVEKPEMRSALKGFIKEELEHKEKLETEKAEGIVLKDEEVGNLGIAEYVEGGEVRPDMSYKDLLILAMKKEDTSVKLYTDLAKIVQDEQLRDTFLLLAQEEAEHKLRFELEYDLTFF
ncbi:MAG: ferritin family protein [Planctomycetota bacterium]|jgi:rubrerythrin